MFNNKINFLTGLKRFLSLTGFTLIEVMISIAILAVVAGMLIPVMRVGIDAWIFIKDKNTALAEGRLAMDRMVNELRQAESIVAPASPCSPSANCAMGDKIAFKLPGSTDIIQYSGFNDGQYITNDPETWWVYRFVQPNTDPQRLFCYHGSCAGYTAPACINYYISFLVRYNFPYFLIFTCYDADGNYRDHMVPADRPFIRSIQIQFTIIDKSGKFARFQSQVSPPNLRQ